MASRQLGFPVFDSDNHMYETRDALTKFLPASYKGLIDYVDVRGRTKIVVRGQISNYIPNPTFDVVAAPGAQEEYFRHGNPEGKSYREIMGAPIRSIPAYREPGPRLELMDELGLDRSMMFPTLASLVEERLRDDPDATHAVVHALNEWMLETWTFNYSERIFPVPVITLPVVERAIEELEWVVAHGAKAVLIRPAPVPGFRGSRSFGLPEFDPFWQRVVDLGVLVTMHGSDSGYTRYANEWEGARGEFEAFRPTAFTAVSMGHRAIQDAITALICHGALSRFPALRVAIIENGAEWVPGLFHTFEEAYAKMPQDFPEHPVEVFRRNLWVHPFHEEDPVGIVRLLGADHVLFGSDYPHPEGLSDPLSFVDLIQDLPETDQAKIMGGNIAGLLEGRTAAAVAP